MQHKRKTLIHTTSIGIPQLVWKKFLIRQVALGIGCVVKGACAVTLLASQPEPFDLASREPQDSCAANMHLSVCVCVCVCRGLRPRHAKQSEVAYYAVRGPNVQEPPRARGWKGPS